MLFKVFPNTGQSHFLFGQENEEEKEIEDELVDDITYVSPTFLYFSNKKRIFYHTIIKRNTI